ncbi:5669_t:CDS:2 [Funneliformis geosporum]|uniref:5669_t:CDS:1 n=1 Tax=Funneliformis geosporum TaxID=1117311 RepID=A0A9W4WYN6_9GLOM|nr:5669_t:CDS:2 [Funneliformis geosporum]
MSPLRDIKEIIRALNKHNNRKLTPREAFVHNGLDKKQFQFNDKLLTFGGFLTFLKNKNVEFLNLFKKSLEQVQNWEADGWVWECPPITQETLDNDFSYSVYKPPQEMLETVAPESGIYEEYYNREPTKSVVSFNSLNNNLLVVPKPTEVAEQMLAKLEAEPKVPYCLSTSGLQVA